MNSGYTIYHVGDSAVTISFGEAIDIKSNDRVHQLYKILKQETIWIDVIPSYSSITIFYNTSAILYQGITSPHEWVKQKLEKVIEENFKISSSRRRTLIVPVCYDLTFAPDIKIVCEYNGITAERLIEIHSHKTYRVFMIGFLPGFAYMGSVDETIRTPRLEKPRAQVPSGSVGIAGSQTGIYPLTSPGGWNIIGRTPLKLFDVDKARRDNIPATLFQPGDEIIFKSISKMEFESFDVSTFNPSNP